MKMKTLIFICILFSLNLCKAQITMNSSHPNDLLLYTKNSVSDKSIKGSKYVNQNFQLATVNKGTSKFLLRFDSFNNLFEYKKNKNEVFELDKNETNAHIEFDNGDKYVLTNYDSPVKTDYLKIINEGEKISIYKLEKTSITAEKKAVSSYDKATPATYKKNKDLYFVSINDKIVELPNREKDFINLFIDKTSEIKTFMNEGKINLKKETDLIKLTTFLNSIL